MPPRLGPAALAVLSLSLPASAQEPQPTSLAPIQVTATREQAAADSVPQPVTVLGAGEIARESPQVMTELLRGQPGAFFQQTGPGQGVVVVRGLKGAEVLHLVDGMRLNNAFFRTAPSQYIALLDPYNIGQLELLRGPYATLYGSDAMGGVVQVLTPEERFAGDGLQYRAQASARYGSASLLRAGRAAVAVGDPTFSVAGGYTFMDHGRRKLAEPGQSPNGDGTVGLAERVNDSDYLARGYDLKTLWNPAPAHELMLSAQYFELPALPRYNETVPGFGTATGGLPEAAQSYYSNDRAFYHLRYRHAAPLGFVDSLELHLARQVLDDDRRDRPLDLSRDSFEFNRSTLTGFTAQAATALRAHDLSFGFDLYDDRIDSRSVREAPPGSGNFTSNAPGGFQSRFPDGARALDFGLYAIDEWRIDDQWLGVGGLRWSRHKTELPQADRALGATLRDDDFTGNLGVRLAITPALAWTANAGRGYRAPNVNDLAQVGRRSNNRLVVANLDLEPESVWSLDSGLRFADRAWLAELTAFRSSYRDRITLLAGVVPEGTGGCPDDGDVDPEPCAQNRNIARATYYGLEAGARWRAMPGLTLFGSLNWTWGEQHAQGATTPANRVPPLNGEAGIEWTVLPQFEVRPSVFYAGRQDRLDPSDQRDNRIDPDGTPGYATVDLQLEYFPLGWLTLELEGRNLLDKAYREHGSGIDGEARGLVASVRATFE